MEKPQTLQQNEDLEYVQGKLRKYDLRDGGIYNNALVRAMEHSPRLEDYKRMWGQSYQCRNLDLPIPVTPVPTTCGRKIPLVSFDFLGWLGDLLDQWGTVLVAVTLLLVCFEVLSFISGLLARCLVAHRIWGCKFHLLAPVLPSVLQWMAIELGLRGVWPAIEGEDPADHKVEPCFTHGRRSVIRDRIDKKIDRKKKNIYHSCGSLVELGTLEAKRKAPPPASRCAIPCMWPATSDYRIYERASPSAEERISKRASPLVEEDWRILCIQTSVRS
jgi:hypothetical protein